MPLWRVVQSWNNAWHAPFQQSQAVMCQQPVIFMHAQKTIELYFCKDEAFEILDPLCEHTFSTRQPGQLLSLRPRSAKSKGCCQPGADSGGIRLTASSAARVSVVTSAASG